MLGIDYGSDSDDDSNTLQPSSTKGVKATPSPGPSKLAPGAALPPPSNSLAVINVLSSANGGLALPPPKAKRSTGPKKILVELPKIDKHASDDELEDERPAAKKPRLGGGGKGGASALLSMLPAPTKTSIELPTQRVLGGGRPGVVYSAASSSRAAAMAEPAAEPDVHEDGVGEDFDAPASDTVADKDTTTSMLPPSMLLKGKVKTAPSISAPKPPVSSALAPLPAVDFFSIGSASSSRISSAPNAPDLAPPTLSISSAPKIEEFRPPSPKTDDPYPGYYQLPSGSWSMHDPAYYKTYSDRWAKEYEAQIRKYEKGLEKGFEGAEDDATVDVSADGLADAARALREEKKALTRGAATEGDRQMPKMKINPQKIGGLARTRHQLSSLLTEAYMNREALEEQIAQGKRNRKEAGNKYGF